MKLLGYDGIMHLCNQYIKPLRTQIGTHKVEADVPANAKFTDTVYTHPTSAGNKHIPAGGASGQILRWSAAGTAVWGNDNNTTYAAFKGATASAAGTAGLVPAPAAGAQAKFLRGDGTWQKTPNTTYSNMKGATASAAGTAGLAPAPAAGAQAKFLRGDGAWAPSYTEITNAEIDALASL